VGQQLEHEEGGQAFASYALVLGLIAVGCIVAIVFLSGSLAGLYRSTPSPGDPGVHRPPTAELRWPATVDDCIDGGWRDYAQFDDEQACIDYVESVAP
jgi:hypothetical protein